ncbi:MAG: hypothetical protein WCJ93_12175 [Methanomicrobiales archaeon]
MIHGFVVMAHYQEALHRTGGNYPWRCPGELRQYSEMGSPPGYRERRT